MAAAMKTFEVEAEIGGCGVRYVRKSHDGSYGSCVEPHGVSYVAMEGIEAIPTEAAKAMTVAVEAMLMDAMTEDTEAVTAAGHNESFIDRYTSSLYLLQHRRLRLCQCWIPIAPHCGRI